jgi:hypothetical protein
MRSWVRCARLCVHVCVCLCELVGEFVCGCAHVYVYASNWVCMCVSFCVHLWESLCMVCMCVYVSNCVCVCKHVLVVSSCRPHAGRVCCAINTGLFKVYVCCVCVCVCV